MTDKLFLENSYLKEFHAKVTHVDNKLINFLLKSLD